MNYTCNPITIALLLLSTSVNADWVVDSKVDLMTDQETDAAIGFAAGSTSDSGASVAIICREESLSAILFFESTNIQAQPSARQGQFDIRFDKNSMRQATGIISTDRTSIFVAPGDVLDFISLIDESKTLLFRHDPSVDPIRVDLSGATQAIRNACGPLIDDKVRQEEVRQAELARLRAEQTPTEAKKAERKRLLKIKSELAKEYIRAIRDAVTKNFAKPEGLEPGASCTVRARLVYPNQVVDVQVERCSDNNSEFKRAVEKAIWSTNPFPNPPHKAVFERVLVFNFEPIS